MASSTGTLKVLEGFWNLFQMQWEAVGGVECVLRDGLVEEASEVA